ncbi:MAG TPA: SRPBCC family protein [Solirubrobacteraceae bacterium]|nr:SRPBCC family protein [Solirubrobacteraceae bacterium]
MARYRATVPSPRSAEDTFAFLADFRTVAEWDPSIIAATLANGGDPLRVGAQFHVRLKVNNRENALDYSTVELEAPSRVVLRGENATVVSIDTMTFAPTPQGCEVTYDAKLELKGLLRLADPIMQILLHRLGRAAETGLRERLARL